jgi:hypothetical protein
LGTFESLIIFWGVLFTQTPPPEKECGGLLGCVSVIISETVRVGLEEEATGPNLDAVWSYNADHTALVVALQRHTTGVSPSAVVRYTTIQPITTTPGGILTRSRDASGVRCWTRCRVRCG